ncbi:hypothetical protein [Staphylococcus saprophyticus]|uniref:hypothetical protein n=1 Tax=Staphylococcus saprophyticus TaxID=29385 RepID=UPI003F55B3DC
MIAAVKQISFFEGEYYFSLEGQNKELLDSFEKSNLSNNEKNRLFKNLTKNHVISENYTRAIKRILIFGFFNKILTLKDINIFLEMNIKGKNLVEIDENLLNASEELIKKYGINTDKIFELFMTIDLSKNNELNLKSKNDIVDMTKFINSKIGKYFNIIAQCTWDNQNNKSKVKEKIEENNFIKSYLMGQFINLYEIEELPPKDINIFIGYSHKYILSNNSRYIDYFELAAKQIFENNMYNEFLYNNLTLILLEKINPILDINFYNVKKEKAKSIFKMMIESYLNDNEYTYFKNWIEWFVENVEMTTTIINKIIERIHLKRFEKLNILLEIFKKLKISKKLNLAKSGIYTNLMNLTKNV